MVREQKVLRDQRPVDNRHLATINEHELFPLVRYLRGLPADACSSRSSEQGPAPVQVP